MCEDHLAPQEPAKKHSSTGASRSGGQGSAATPETAQNLAANRAKDVAEDLARHGFTNVATLGSQGANGCVYRATSPGGFKKFIKLVEFSATPQRTEAEIREAFDAERCAMQIAAGTRNVKHMTGTNGVRNYLVSDFHPAGSVETSFVAPRHWWTLRRAQQGSWTRGSAKAASRKLRLMVFDIASQLHRFGAPVAHAAPAQERVHHTDVKAGNILETRVSGWLYYALADWGCIVRRRENSQGALDTAHGEAPFRDCSLDPPEVHRIDAAAMEMSLHEHSPRTSLATTDGTLPAHPEHIATASADIYRLGLALRTLLSRKLLKKLPKNEQRFWREMLVGLTQPHADERYSADETAVKAVLQTRPGQWFRRTRIADPLVSDAALSLRRSAGRMPAPTRADHVVTAA